MYFVIAIVLALIFFLGFKLNAKSKSSFSFLFAGILFLAVSVTQILTVVPAGHVGVIDIFGKVPDQALNAGIHFRNPFARIIKLSVKTQEFKETMSVPSKEGLTVNLEISVLYRLDPDKAANIYKTVGLNYVDVILTPNFRSVAREVTASYEAKALYTSEREVLGQTIQKALVAAVKERGIVVESTPLRHVGLPQRLTQAIEQKLEAEQESQRMEFVLLKEAKEAERKRIKAKGIADFQQIVTKGISEPLLRWKGIEATEKLANSANTKIVVIGGKDGLPLILNDSK